eukprot:TRINITY_DN65955_c0_g1_i1.p1 TRINITY_DN65955_c0_g1~~TRINITY_DN65955_c0_g1_i1.p1  ORF type:complete len:367 (+),score=73.90 TRINITY_DN65955_c0_g1_i1:139-1239(+)
MLRGAGGVAANEIDVSKEESDRLEREAELLEQRLAALRSLQRAPTPDPNRGPGAGVSRWRSAAEDIEVDEEPGGLRRSMDAGFGADTASGVEDYGRHFSAAAGVSDALDVEDPPDARGSATRVPRRKTALGEWVGIDEFLDSLGLGRIGYAELLRGKGLDTPEALERLDPNRMRKLGMDHKHAMKLRVGVAELRAFASAKQEAVGPSAGSSNAGSAFASPRPVRSTPSAEAGRQMQMPRGREPASPASAAAGRAGAGGRQQRPSAAEERPLLSGGAYIRSASLAAAGSSSCTRAADNQSGARATSLQRGRRSSSFSPSPASRATNDSSRQPQRVQQRAERLVPAAVGKRVPPRHMHVPRPPVARNF